MKEKLAATVAALAVVVSIMGGIFFGLFSCGGYVWHKQLFATIFTFLLLFVLFMPPEALRALWKRVVFFVTVPFIYFVVLAAASSFYPSAPDTWSEFMASFFRGLEYGPC